MEQHHFDIVNHATPRLASMDKALGRGKYTDDLELPNMAYAALVRCPYSHAKVLSIDVSEAEKVPGFLGCALPEEAPQAYFNCSGNPPSPLLMADEKVLTTEPLTIGDRVAVVAAETEEAARTLCVTINPVSAYGWKFDKDEFMTRMREAVDVPVINVKEELT